MITCTSERSGMASSGMCRTEYTPINTSAAVVSRTMNLFWSENSMMRLSMVSVEVQVCPRNEPADEPCRSPQGERSQRVRVYGAAASCRQNGDDAWLKDLPARRRQHLSASP